MGAFGNQLIQSCCLAESSRNAYAVQLHRLASFRNWPHQGKLSAWSFTSAGFFHTGHGDEVKCFSCGLTLGRWAAGSHPLTAHCELSGGLCDFVSSQRRSGDVPLGTAAQLLGRPAAAQTATPAVGSCSAAAVRSAADDNGSLEVAAGSQLTDCLASCYASMPLPPPVTLERLLKEPRPAEGGCSHRSLSVEPGRQQQLLLPQEEAEKYELYRLQTFLNVWAHSTIVTPRELAASGFHYTGPGDRVQCAFCQGLLRNWEHGDRAAEQHAQHFTYCRFVQGHDVGNVPIPFSALEPKFTNEQDVAEGLGISRAVPKQPDLAVESRRLATFITWPSTHPLMPEVLAKAGFFYLGNDDAVKCFYCHGTVKEWPRGSDPWVEHAKRFSSCPFVEQVKGRDFALLHNASGSASNPSSQMTSFAVDPREIRARMDSPKVRILLQMDYPLDLLREVVQKRLAAVNDDHETSEELLADVFVVHDAKQQTAAPRIMPGQLPPAGLPVVLAASKAAASAAVGSTDLPWPLPAVAASAILAEGRLSPDMQLQPSLTALLDPPTGPATILHPEEENRQLKTQLTCKICMDSLVGIVFLPCGHFVCCPACAPALTTCPICRVSIRGTVRTLL